MKKQILFINIRSHKIERLEPLFAAQRLGLDVVLLCDSVPDVERTLIKDVIVANSYNLEECMNLVKDHHKRKPISGVLTWADKDVPLVSLIANELNLPAIPYHVVSSVRNKMEMRSKISETHPEICPKFRPVSTYEELKIAYEEIGTPAIFKPVGASGSKGIFKIDKNTNLKSIFAKMMESTSEKKDKVFSYFPNQFIFEEFLEGDEISIEGVIQDGNIFIVGVTDKQITDEYSLEYKEIFPSKYYESNASLIEDFINKVIESLEINNCSFHAECKFNTKNKKISLIEIAGRPGGGFITSHLIPLSSGISFHEQVIKVAIGEKVESKSKISVWYPLKRGYSGHVDCYTRQEGILKSLDGLDSVFEDPNVIITIPTAKIGSQILQPPCSFTSLFITTSVVKGKTYEEVENALAKIQSKIKITIGDDK